MSKGAGRTMRRTGLFLLSLFGSSAVAGPHPTIRTVEVVGNRFFSASSVVSLLNVQMGAAYDPTSLRREMNSLVNEYRSEGFAEAAVDSLGCAISGDSSVVDLRVYVHEGMRTLLRSVRWENAHALTPDEIGRVSELAPGTPFTSASVERDIRSVLTAYANRGYAFATASVSTIDVDNSGKDRLADVTISVNEGARAVIRSVRVKGNSTTRESVILREARVEPGTVFDPTLTDRVRKRLERLGLFSAVADPQMFVDDGNEAGLLLGVTEGSYNSFDGVLGYMPAPSAGGSGYLVGLADVQFRNLFGTARKLSLHWYRDDRVSQEIEIRYREPWIFDAPVGVGVGFFQRKQDSSYVMFKYDLAADGEVSENLTLGVSVSYLDIVPTAGFGQTLLPASSTSSVGGMARYDDRDDPFNPTSGVAYATTVETGWKHGIDRTSTQRITMDLGFAFEVFPRQVFVPEFHLRGVQSGSLDFSDLYPLGGARTLRGYRESQFLASRMAWSNLEYRVLIGGRSSAYGFLDAAVIDRRAPMPEGSPLFRAGYGAGIRLDTSMGLLGVSIALGQGDSFGTAKLHLALANEF